LNTVSHVAWGTIIYIPVINISFCSKSK